MTPQELKNSILQLAIQGKLVEQRPEEGTAEELYQQIQAEKQRLIKEGKIKKEKPLPEISEDEKPFDIPESWRWVHWGEVVNIVSARRVHQSDWKGEGIPFYRAREIAKLAEDGYVDNELYISQELYDEYSKSGVPHPGDLMVTAVGTLGKTYIVRPEDRFYYKDASVICLENYGNIVPEYLKFVMQSEMMMKQIRSNSSGTTVATLTMVRMVEYLLPLPPLAEQKRIVAKIEELLPYVDRYEKAWNKLEELNKRFPIDLQKSILQIAIQGKLVEQHPEEGTGEKLYQQIQAEKQRLIKEGKIKREKPLPEISEDEIPFDIPEGWMWVRIGDLFLVGTGMTPLKSERKFYSGGNIPWINSTLTSKRYIDQTDTYVTNYAVENTSLKIYPTHTIIIAMYGQGKTRGQVSELLIPATVNQACAALENILYYQTLVDYVYYFLKFNYEVMRRRAEGTSQPNLNLQKIKEIALPLPPLAEQKRIDDKLKELLPLCEKLKK